LPVISISIDDSLLTELSAIVERRGYQGRSEAIRDAIRTFVDDYKLMKVDPAQITAAILVSYLHDKKTEQKLVELRHVVDGIVVESLHRHIGENCLDVFIVEGISTGVYELISKMEVIKGISVRYVLSSR